jgi:lipopolysaccharide biosynthesis glycosyltransferase
MKNEKNILVTLADRNYVDLAKQLFSSVYFNAGWTGDYMLLAHNIPEKEINWFQKRGILVKKCEPLYYKKLIKGYSSTILSKFYLFAEEMKKWQNIIYLDADIIVRANLDDLAKVKGFAAVLDLQFPKLLFQLKSSKELFKEFSRYNLDEPPFNSGVLAFSTNIIEKDTFSKLKEFFKKYGKYSRFPDQGIFNLFFYKKWKKLPLIYNINPEYLFKIFLKLKRVDAIILHFTGGSRKHSKALTSDKYQFYKEWKYNLDRADKIDLKKIPKGKKWSKIKKISYSSFIRLGDTFYKKVLKNAVIIKGKFF